MGLKWGPGIFTKLLKVMLMKKMLRRPFEKHLEKDKLPAQGGLGWYLQVCLLQIHVTSPPGASGVLDHSSPSKLFFSTGCEGEGDTQVPGHWLRQALLSESKDL